MDLVTFLLKVYEITRLHNGTVISWLRAPGTAPPCTFDPHDMHEYGRAVDVTFPSYLEHLKAAEAFRDAGLSVADMHGRLHVFSDSLV